jgi:hypothetical protein
MQRLTCALFLTVTLGAAACGPANPPPSGPPVAGNECAAEQCGPAPGMPTYACDDGTMGGPTGKCVMGEGGQCGWEITECKKSCVKGGCSQTLCIEEGEDVMTTCEWRPEYACYQNAQCERQSDGGCGWTQTQELAACIASPPPPPTDADQPPQ